MITTVCSSFAKAFVEYSNFTLAKEPVRVQVMFWAFPTIQISAPLGAVKVTDPLIVKFALETSLTAESLTLVRRTFTVEEMASGIVQA